MPSQVFPIDYYVNSVVRFLDIIQYNDTNYTAEERVAKLHYAYTKTARHFAHPDRQRHIKASPKKLQASLQTIVAMVVYSWATASNEVMADLSIHYTYMLILDDSHDDPADSMKSFYNNMLAGRPQEHPWWQMVNDQFPQVLRHYGPYCGLNMIRSTTDFFQGCWVEQHNFLGFPGSFDYPNFLRRLNGLGHCVGGSIFPKERFDENELFTEITTAIAQMENWMVFVNDLLSFYKEFDEPRDQTSLVNNYSRCNEITLEQALEKLTMDTIVDSEQLLRVFHDKDHKILHTLCKFLQGYVTWHLCDPRYRLQELDSLTDELSGVSNKLRNYLQSAKEVGSVDPKAWAYPSVANLAAEYMADSTPVEISGATDEAIEAMWAQNLRDMEDATVFPVEQPSESSRSCVRGHTLYTLSGFPLMENLAAQISAPNLIHAAWATLIAKETNATSVTFAISASDSYPTPIVVHMNGNLSVGEFLREVEQNTIRSLPLTTFALEKWGKIPLTGLNTLIKVDADDEGGKPITNLHNDIPRDELDELESSFPLVLGVSANQQYFEVTVDYNAQFIDQSKVSVLIERLDFTISQLCDPSSQKTLLNDMNFCSPRDMAKILKWNSASHEPVDDCIHWEFSKQAALQPEAEAISGWDRCFTYQQLDISTAQLAEHLQSLPKPVGPGVTVPICFPKSAYAVVAMLAVLRAGGAYTPIDPAFPQSRILEILGQLGSTTVLASPENAHLFDKAAVEQTVELSESTLTALAADVSTFVVTNLPEAKPSDPCMILFTSGSTGKPKGIVMEHKSVCKVFREHGKASGFRKGMRTLQFSAHTYDVCHGEIFETLYWGGTVCIPSEEERMSDIAGFINRHNVDWACLTPSVAGLLDPTQMPCLKTLGLGGEAVPGEVLRLWRNFVRIVLMYGPSECSIYTSAKDLESDSDIGTLGIGRGCSLWIVDPHNHNVLVPIGAVGELVVEGPIVAREYLKNPELSEKVFISDPHWQVKRDGASQTVRRYCKTGDLVRYDADGAVRFVGRKDTMIKLRGQRLELGDVELHLKLAFPMAKTVYPTIIMPEALGTAQHLTAFILMDRVTQHASPMHATKDIDPSGIYVSILGSDEWHSIVQKAQDILTASLPRHMIPTMFIPMLQLPLSASMKTDQKRLRELGASLTLDQLTLLNAATTSKSLIQQRQMSKEEKIMHSLWALALGRETSHISLGDHFFLIGGDSVLAMKLVRLARDAGYAITYKDVFQAPILADLAKIMTESVLKESSPDVVEPFSLLSSGASKDEILWQVARQLDIEPSMIGDILPCTPFQEALITSTVRQPGSYVARSVFRLRQHIDVQRLQSACETLVSSTPPLRTRIVDLPEQGFLQVVVDEPLQWLTHGTKALTDLSRSTLGLNSPLALFEVIEGSEDAESCLILTLHHAVYDGHSIPLMLRNLESLYYGEAMLFSPTPFPLFLDHIKKQQDQSVALQFWRDQFSGDSAASVFLGLNLPNLVPFADSHKKRCISNLAWPKVDVTPATIVRTAWSILQSQYTGSLDVLFGASVSGRQTPLPGIDFVVAPTMATVPVRIQLDETTTLDKIQRRIQAHALEMISYEQVGLPYIRRISPAAEHACQFQTLLIVQPASEDKSFSPGLFRPQESSSSHVIHSFVHEAKDLPLVLECQLERDGVGLHVNFDARFISDEQVGRILIQFEHILRQTCDIELRQKTLCDIDLMSPDDMSKIWNWNFQVPETIDNCVHDIIHSMAQEQPEALAIEAWDGKMTYQELDTKSTILAEHMLQQFGQCIGKIVPLCFAKSMWVPVAALAVMKAGGACLLLDTAQPNGRLQAILEQIKPEMMICSVTEHCRAIALGGTNILTLGETQMSDICSTHRAPEIALPKVPASSLLYLTFTSGSTGAPKGVRISHANFASALHHQKGRIGYDRNSRVYDFASYSFDISWSNIIHTLAYGGCICIPSLQERGDNLVGSIQRFKANAANLTDSVLDLLSPSTLPLLKTVISAGEVTKPSTLKTWSSAVSLYQIYGPAECTPLSTGQLTQDHSYLATMGTGLGFNTWVVDASGKRLVPIGVVGELWLEGPAVGLGYLDDDEKTSQAFVVDPPWLVDGTVSTPGRRGRCYRTGDLVKYHEDGTLEHMGRKDDQVKIRGQRVELGEIEHQISRGLVALGESSVTKIAVEVVIPKNSTEPTLLGFLTQNSVVNDENTWRAGLTKLGDKLNSWLSDCLVAYMIPSGYIPVTDWPVSSTGKLDRRRLRELGSKWSLQDLQNPGLQSPESNAVEKSMTAAETRLRALWAMILKVDVSAIQSKDNFLRVGGDSIKAVRLVTAARKQGLVLSVAKILKRPRLSDMALTMTEGKELKYHEPQPFSLLEGGSTETQRLLKEIGPVLSFSTDQVRDIAPTTYTQALCVDAATYTPPQGCFVFHIDIPGHVPLEKIKGFAQMLWKNVDILRTVFVKSASGDILQVIPGDVPVPLETHEVDAASTLQDVAALVFEKSLQPRLELGAIYVKFMLIYGHGKPTRFGFRVSHGHFDGVSLIPILACLAATLQDRDWPIIPKFVGYIGHVHKQDAKTMEHWKRALKGSKPMALQPTGAESRIMTMTKIIESPPRIPDFTAANIFLAACAEALAHLHDTLDVNATLTVSGRTMLPGGLDNVIGPCLNQVPLRVSLPADRSFGTTLTTVKQAQLDMLPAEVATSQSIYKTCAQDWPEHQRKMFYNVQFHNVIFPSVDLLGDGVKTPLKVHGPTGVWEHSEEIWVIARPVEDTWHIALSANASNCTQKHLENVGDTIASILALVNK
ncbi:nonribosomal peptide synthase [Aspergillus pseudoviridinutans]|uniref:Nonribosomal peptide synthase n=1 Tax=Aspergillus pseudoviridinutans TaxID=1517512 RepID=A0A9P3EVQ2_9EURO|nr:nonribosomal peptide synthase [Aspergillus pseudoviridinutans]GIJ87025.1 nonribosomal peptide synthase [Aspergillus pseudoviridinutans]